MLTTPVKSFHHLYELLKHKKTAWASIDIKLSLFNNDPELTNEANQSLREALLVDAIKLGIDLDNLQATPKMGLTWPEKVEDSIYTLDNSRLWYRNALYQEVGTVTNGVFINQDKSTVKIPRSRLQHKAQFSWLPANGNGKRCLVYKDTVYSECDIKPTEKPEPLLVDKLLKPTNNSNAHLLIEGDNIDALRLLLEKHKDSVNVIYIDPPYNTGNTGFKYKDSYDKNTVNGIHPSWLSFMKPRLELARDLLDPTGTLFISIDDNEYASLKLLCDSIFQIQNYTATLVWKKKNTPPNDKILGGVHEYILVYAKDKSRQKLHRRKRDSHQTEKYKNPDNHVKGPWVAGDLTANVKGGRYVAHLYYPIKNPNTGDAHYPPNKGNWRFNAQRVNELLANDEIYFGKDGRGKPKLKRFLCDVKDGVSYSTIWDNVGFNADATKELQRYFHNAQAFDTPKPVSLIKELLALSCSTQKNALVMDFFAGSGTTGEAVLALNAEDSGERRFILITNNENEICEDICYPRVQSALRSYNSTVDLHYQKIIYTLNEVKTIK